MYPFRGGIAQYTEQLCDALEAQGHEVLLVSFRRQYPRVLYPGRTDRVPGADGDCLPHANYWIDSLRPGTWVATFVRIRRYAPDAMVLQWWSAFWAPVWLLFLLLNRLTRPIPTIFICHNVYPHEAGRVSILLSRVVLRTGDACLVHSEQERQRLLEANPHATVTVQGLPVFSLGSRHTALRPRQAAREDLGLSQAARVFLFFGIVRPYKGLDDLIAAFVHVRQELPEAVLLVAGEFWEPRIRYEKLIQDLGLCGSVRIDDRYVPDQDLVTYMSAADVVVAPYRRVTGSAVVQTARGLGVPVLATRMGGLVELAKSDSGVRLVESSSPCMLARAMVSSGGSPPSRRRSHPVLADQSWRDLATAVEDAIRLAGDPVVVG